MKVHANAVPIEGARAIGRIELECTPVGLSVVLFQLASYSEGYAPGPITSGFRLIIPYLSVRMRQDGDVLELRFEAPNFPYPRLMLSRFSAGPGVPPHELRQRRTILHLSAISLAGVLAIVVAALLARQEEPSLFLPLVYGAVTASLVLALGFSIDQRFFLRPPDEAAARQAFAFDLESRLPSKPILDERRVARRPPTYLEKLAALLPTRTGTVGATLAGAILTLLVAGKAIFGGQAPPQTAALAENVVPTPTASLPEPPLAPAPPSKNDDPKETPPSPDSPAVPADSVSQERACLCDRADSPLWAEPLPRLSGLLLDSRIVPRTTQNRLEVEVAVINNGDEPLKDITLHVAFFEGHTPGKSPTTERPLYYEGPLRPGAAVKWTTEAKGESFRLLVPDFGRLGQNGEGAAPAEAFRELLSANHRPVRLHAARVLGYLGDPIAKEAALKLKDAYRAREAPFLRRVLTASGTFRVCDVQVDNKSLPPRVQACVYNGSESPANELGLWVQELDHSLDPSQPLANPPELLRDRKLRVLGSLAKNSGGLVSVPLSGEFATEKRALELILDRFEEFE
jgi:hypothetical protein